LQIFSISKTMANLPTFLPSFQQSNSLPPLVLPESFSDAGLSNLETQGQFKKKKTHFVLRNGTMLTALADKTWAAFKQVKCFTR